MELLSPAGHWEAMVAAVQSGADAVYLGCGAYNARRGARNFTREELPRAVSYCHLRGVKVYLTLNTLLSDRELARAGEEITWASDAGVDAVIVQDWGLLALARAVAPELPLHGSTQMTVHSLRGAEEAARLGLRCVVLARELSREDIAHIARHSPVPVEVFVHGALCMCWSGQCAMSAMLGGRSGNRGLCAQPCRLPYRLDGGAVGYPLSLKDMNLSAHLGELRDMGVSILKLEGRMKRPEYVAVVTGIYAALLRENRPPREEERSALESAFSREGFTDGYWRDQRGPGMFGVRGDRTPEPAELFREAKARYSREDARKVSVTMEARVQRGTPCQLTVRDGQGHSVTVSGPVPETARTRALTKEDLVKQLGKTGGTVFSCEDTAVRLEEGLSLSLGALNALRRQALEALSRARTKPPVRETRPVPPPPTAEARRGAFGHTVSLTRPDQLTEALVALAPDRICLPAERIEAFDLSAWGDYRGEWCVTLPRVCKDREEPALRRCLERAREKGVISALIGNLGQVSLAGALGFTLRGDLGLNVFNSRSLLTLRSWGLESATVSFELRWEQIRDLAAVLPLEAVVYGRLPLMLTENCLVANALGCKAGNLRGPCVREHGGRTGSVLTDRRGERFPILPAFGCRSEIENSQVLYLADKNLTPWGLRWGRLRFTTETGAECAEILARYRGKDPAVLPEAFTRGLYYRGVE